MDKFIFCIVFLLCTPYIFSQKEFSIVAINKELTEYSNSVLIDELIEIDVTNINKVKRKKYRVVAVLNKLGDRDTHLFEFYDGNSSVKHIEVKIYDRHGKQMERFKKKDFIDVSRTGINMYSDDRMMFLNYTPTTYPYIVVFESETETGDSAFIDSWYPLGDYAESTQKSVMKIKYSPDNKPKYKTKNLEGYAISISESPEEISFSASNLKAIRYEEQSPSIYNILPGAIIALNTFKLKGKSGTGEDWEKFGTWMDKSLLTDVSELPEGTLARIKSLVANEPTNEAKARKIYQYVQDKVRYISIQIGIGGWKPMSAQEVDKLSYGDCKALTNYTKTLLDAVGIPSYYTIVYGDENERDIISDFTSFQGDHVILGVPDGDEITWLECTSQDTPYGYIGNFTDDRDVLMITPEGGKIAHTKVYETEENTRENISKVKVDTEGTVYADFESISRGLQYESRYLLPKQKQDDIDIFYKKRWRYINGFSLNSINFNDDRQNIVFTENVSLTIPNYANPVGDDYLFCANIFNQNQDIPPRIVDRKQDLYLDYGFINTDTVEIEIPENFVVDVLPDSTVLETKFGKYEIRFSKTDENNLVYHRRLQINKGLYPPAEYENYRDFLRNITRLDKTKILLKQNVQ